MIRYGPEQMRYCQVPGCRLLCGPTREAGEAHQIVHGHYPKFAEGKREEVARDAE